MKHLHHILILAFLMLFNYHCSSVFAYIEVKNEDGVTIYYDYISDGKELEVIPAPGYDRGGTNYTTKTLRIPDEVTYMNRTRKVTSIADYAFYHAKIETLIIGDNVRTIGDCFSGRIFNPDYSDGGFLKKIVFGKSVESIKCSFSSDSSEGNNSLEKVIIMNINKWLSFDHKSSPFHYAKKLYIDEDTELTRLDIPEGVKRIGRGAFSGCTSLSEVIIPNSVDSVGDFAFSDSGMQYLTIGSGIKVIGEGAFARSKLLKVCIKNIASWCNVSFNEKYDSTPFLGFIPSDNFLSSYSTNIHLCGEGYSVIKNLEIPKTVTSIKKYHFFGFAGLKSVAIPDNVTSIEVYSFSCCPDLETVSFGDKITTINGFNDCPKLSHIQWGKKVETVEYYAFHGHNISSLVLPEGIKSIGAAAFSSNQLTSVVIPNSVVEIQSGAFYSDNLLSVTSFIRNPESTSWEYNLGPFSDNTLYNATLYVPKGTIGKYKATKGWNKFVWIEEFDATDIDSIQDIHHESSLFSINGTRIPKMKRGINIIKMSDGTTKKVLVK